MNEEEIGNEQKDLDTEEFASYYLDLKTNNPEKKTPSNYKETFHRLEDYMEQEDIEWDDFGETHAKRFSLWLRDDEGLHSTTIQRHIDKISRFIRGGEEPEYADTTEEEEAIIKALKDINLDSSSLTQDLTGEETLWVETDEYVKMAEACESTREELIIRFLWETGVRRSELAELTIQRIDRDESIVYINNKKNDDTRDIPYSDEIKPILREWLDYGGRDSYKPANNSPYLIVSQQSEQVQGAFINEVVKRVSKRAGVSYVYGQDAAGRDLRFPTAHHFRHAYATHRVANGMNLEIVKKLMGHKSVTVTSKYVGLKSDVKKDANEKYRPKSYDRETELVRQI
jgi:site-specific recombinase XerD